MKHMLCPQNLAGLAAMVAVVLLVTISARGAANYPPTLETMVIGQSRFLAESTASLRIVTLRKPSAAPIAGAAVEAVLKSKDGSETKLFKGRTDRKGTLNASFKIPDLSAGSYSLIVTTRTLKEKDVITSDVTIYTDSRILLTTDKPLYQPGQTMHIRCLALNRANRTAVSGKKMIFEVEDGKGNKVFKKTCETSDFGIASTDFILADEVNMGRYIVRAVIDNSKVEKNITVERYVLPKFKVKFTPDKSYYLAGETVSGKIQSDYFFGKPVSGARVEIKASTFDFQFKQFAEVVGKTDDTGAFSFEQKLPDYFVGQPLEQGNAFVKLEISVKDTADHTEKITQSVPVAAHAIQITAVPEGGRIIAGVENIIYIMTSYPDGTPALTDVNVKAGEDSAVQLKTSDSGICEFRYTPTTPNMSLSINAHDSSNRTASTGVTLSGSSSEDSVLLRTSKAIARVGDKLDITVFSPAGRGSAYIDVIRDSQTVRTDAVDFRNGRADFDLNITDEMVGTVEVNAYRISKSGNIVRDTRLLIVEPARDLNVKITSDKDTYLPGKPAKIDFAVTGQNGKGMPAALGVSIVDESVFALQDMQPGMEKIYFLLEKELMEPKFEIHGLNPGDIFLPVDHKTRIEERDTAARVLFALAQQNRQQNAPVEPYSLIRTTYREKLEKWAESVSKDLITCFNRVAPAVEKYYKDVSGTNIYAVGLDVLVQKDLLKQQDLLDPWGRELMLPAKDYIGYNTDVLVLISLGPDGKKGTDDDMVVGGPLSDTREAKAALADGQEGIWNVIGQHLFFGGRGENVLMEDRIAMPAMAGAPGALGVVRKEMAATGMGGGPAQGSAQEPVRIRQYFPETMYFNPSIITDDSGKAQISVDCADSITTWRITTSASTKTGDLGSATGGLRVFQDFFIDIDLPVSLTQNDEVSIPIAVYNYLPDSQTVTLEMDKGTWFELKDSESKKLEIGQGDVRVVYYRIKVKEIGSHKLTVHATGSKMSDAISRSIDIIPDGKLFESVENGALEKTVETSVKIPEMAIDGASNILVKVYPGIFSTLVEGMDSIFQMPFGCFEQTTSTTYPNVLALDYMKATNQAKPEVRMKAEQYINLGYQRLVTFEVNGGGFSWFGDAPANKVLTAYGVMEFADMSKVWEVDSNLISRTQNWLISKRESDGSWKADPSYLHEESWGRIQNSNLLPTAWISWCLLKSGYQPAEMSQSISYLKEHALEAKDPYSAALVANALVCADKDNQATRDALKRLVDMAKEDGDVVYWKAELPTVTFSQGPCADIEATALAALALIDSGSYQNTVTKALNYIVKSKSPGGTWGSTQATVMSLKALLSSVANNQPDVDATIKVIVNGQEADQFKITKEDSDVMRQVDCRQFVKTGNNTVKLEFSGKGSLMYAVVNKHYIPWKMVQKEAGKLITIDVDYDRTELQSNDILSSSVKIALNRAGTANMPIVDLGVPPGFQVISEDLDALVAKGVIQRYSLTGRQIILYFDKLENGKPIMFTYKMKAKFPIKAKTPKSEVYLYYEPEVRATASPVDLVVN